MYAAYCELIMREYTAVPQYTYAVNCDKTTKKKKKKRKMIN